MELDFIPNINEYNEHVVRLYNFSKADAQRFRDLIETAIIRQKKALDLSKIDFIKPRNCNLIMGLFKTDEGIFTKDEKTFYCALKLESYCEMIRLIEPFCDNKENGYQYLYDVDNPIDLLFAPAGVWE